MQSAKPLGFVPTPPQFLQPHNVVGSWPWFRKLTARMKAIVHAPLEFQIEMQNYNNISYLLYFPTSKDMSIFYNVQLNQNQKDV